MNYDCMTPEELVLWTEAARSVNHGSFVPCYDCPAWYAAEAKSRGCCNSRPMGNGRPSMTEMEKLAARLLREHRAKRSAASRRYRARLRDEVAIHRAAAAANV